MENETKELVKIWIEISLYITMLGVVGVLLWLITMTWFLLPFYVELIFGCMTFVAVYWLIWNREPFRESVKEYMRLLRK